MNFTCKQRQNASDQFRDDNSCGQRQRDDKSKTRIMILDQDANSVCKGEDASDDNRDTKFFKNNFKNVFEMNF